MGFVQVLRRYWKQILCLLTPLILLPLVLIGTREAKCAFVIGMMAIYWMSEVVPLAVTSFLPIFLFPILEVATVAETCAQYLKDTNFLFVGGIIVAIAVEESNLHRRIALRVLLFMGAKLHWLILGFMIVTAFLSMWMSNTATTAMLVPIAVAVLEEFTKNDDGENGEPGTDLEMLTQNANETPTTPAEVETQPARAKIRKLTKAELQLGKAVILSICFAANIGGIGTLTGTAPNLILYGQLESFYSKPTDVNFPMWLAIGIPPMIVTLLLGWIWLLIFFLRSRISFRFWRKSPPKPKSSVEDVLRVKYQQLGSMKFDEVSVLIWFIVLVLLWVFRDPDPKNKGLGWGSLFKDGYVSDASSAMFVACILFIWPNKNPFAAITEAEEAAVTKKTRTTLVNWGSMQESFPWSVIMLLGGGFAVAKGVGASGLSKWLGCFLESSLGGLTPGIILAICVSMTTVVTTFCSNSATTSMFVPVVLSLANNMQINPLYFAVPCTIAASFAFMLPISTPPNAIVYESGLITIIDMAVAGFVMNVIGLIVNLFFINTYTYWVLNLGVYPSWGGNVTISCFSNTTM